MTRDTVSEARLAKLIHQTAKMLVALLEKEYGFGKNIQMSTDIRETAANVIGQRIQ